MEYALFLIHALISGEGGAIHFFAFLSCSLSAKGIRGLDIVLIAENAVLIALAVIFLIYSIRKKKHRHNSIFDINAFCDSEMPVLIVWNDGTVLFCNAAAEKLFLTEGKRIENNELYAAIRKAKANGESKAVIKTDDRVFSAYCIYHEGTVCVLFTEITEHIRREEKTTEFISVLTHEMRAPLTIIKGFAQNLDEGYSTIDEQQKQSYYKDIISEADRLSELVNNTLKITKLESGIMKTETEPLDISYCINTFLERLQILCSEKGITCSAKADEQIIALFEYDSFMQMLTILCDNAVKYTDSPGQISIGAVSADKTAAVTNNRPLYICNAEIPLDNSRIFVYVQDSGMGINRNDLPRIFDKLYTGDRSRKKGTGLGLSLAKSIVQSVGETMIAASSEDKGSIIGFTLTRYTDEEK